MRVTVAGVSMGAEGFTTDVVNPEELLHVLVNKCKWALQPEVQLERFDHR